MRLFLCKFINIQQSTKTFIFGVCACFCVSLSISNRVLKHDGWCRRGQICVSLSISNRVLKQGIIVVRWLCGVSLSISNRVLKLLIFTWQVAPLCKFINIQQSTKTGYVATYEDGLCKFINIQQSTKTMPFLLPMRYGCKFINIQQSTKTLLFMPGTPPAV